MKNVILKIVKNTGGLKLPALVERLNKKSDEEIKSKEVRKMVAELAAENELILVEFRLPEETDPKMFILPKDTDILSGEEVEKEVILPSEMFTGFAVFSGNFTPDGPYCADAVQAHAKLMKEVGNGNHAQAYGLVPLTVESTLVLVEPAVPEQPPVTVAAETPAA